MMKDSVELFKIVFDFLSGLAEGDLQALRRGRAKLRLLRDGEGKKAKSYPDMSELRRELEKYAAIEEAVAHLTASNLSRAELAGLVLAFNLPLSPKDSSKTLLGQVADYLKQNETMANIGRENVNPHGYDAEEAGGN